MPASDVDKAYRELDRALHTSANAKRAVSEKAYLKSDLKHFGASVPVTRAAVVATLRKHALDRHDALAIAARLFDSPWYEHRLAAVFILGAREKLLQAEDLPAIEALLRRSETWALVDELSARTIGPLVERNEKLRKTMKKWSKDGNFWVRRSALLSQLIPLRSGRADMTLFTEMAAPLLSDKEFFIRKAIGWILRDASRKRPALTETFLLSHAAACSPLTYREAIKYLPAAAREKLDRLRAPDRSGKSRV